MPDANGWTATGASTATWTAGSSGAAKTWTGTGSTAHSWTAANTSSTKTWIAPTAAADCVWDGALVPIAVTEGSAVSGVNFIFVVREQYPQWCVKTDRPITITTATITSP